jgi:hypothetical protein
MSSPELARATKSKYQAQFQVVKGMQVKQKRHIFGILRQNEGLDADAFLPLYGLHCGEFACFQILSEQYRKEGKEARPESEKEEGEA